jgi:hypothetical protein
LILVVAGSGCSDSMKSPPAPSVVAYSRSRPPPGER